MRRASSQLGPRRDFVCPHQAYSRSKKQKHFECMSIGRLRNTCTVCFLVNDSSCGGQVLLVGMSLELVEAIFKEQAQALSTAQRCQDQLKDLLRDYMQRHHNATHNSQSRSSSTRQQQDTIAAPFDQAAPIRQEQQPAITCEDSHSDEDLIQGLQEFYRTRQQDTSQQPTRLKRARSPSQTQKRTSQERA